MLEIFIRTTTLLQAWVSDHVINDFQEDFIVDLEPEEPPKLVELLGIKWSFLYHFPVFCWP